MLYIDDIIISHEGIVVYWNSTTVTSEERLYVDSPLHVTDIALSLSVFRLSVINKSIISLVYNDQIIY